MQVEEEVDWNICIVTIIYREEQHKRNPWEKFPSEKIQYRIP